MPKKKPKRIDKRIRPHLVLTVAPEVRKATLERAAGRGVPISTIGEEALRLFLQMPPRLATPAVEAP